MAKVLVIRLSSFGDVAMLVPVIASVAAQYPQDRFTVMTRKAFAPLFENLGFNISVMAVDVNKKHKGTIGLLKLVKRVVSSGFSHVVDEHDVLRSKIIRGAMKLLGRKVRHLDKGRKEKANMIASKQLTPPLTPTIQRYLDTFAKADFPADLTFSNILDFVPHDFSMLKSVAKEKTGRWIGIAPFAKHRGKIYPIERLANIVETLSKEKNTTLFLFGAGKEEKAVLSEWAEDFPNVIDISGKLNLETELILISYIDVMFTMDSANMHLASLVQTPVVSVWGATHPAIGFYGFNQDPDNIVQIDLECRPCSVYGDLPCARSGDDYACMMRISESAIIDKIHSVLEKKGI